jgi:superfamily II DNA helicase RecQ
VIHLDAYHTVSQQVGIWNELNKYVRQSQLSVVILSSQQVICSSDLIQEMFWNILDRGAMQLLCIDEAHLFVQFGLYFIDKFLLLKDLVFAKCLKNNNQKYMKIPVLFMTGMVNKTILNQLERLTGFEFDKQAACFLAPGSAHAQTQSLDVISVDATAYD